MVEEVSVQENFDDPQGRFVNYDTYDLTQRYALANQKHLDIRTFEVGDVTTQMHMLYLDTLPMQYLVTQTMQDLMGTLSVGHHENWTEGTIAAQVDRNYWNGLNLTCVIGTNVTDSVMTMTPGDEIISLDLETGFTDDDSISLALPDYPLGSIDEANSFVVFTSDPAGAFTGDIEAVAFSESTEGLIEGDSELRFPRSLIGANVDLSSVTGIRLVVEATAGCTFRCLAIRLLSQTWVYAPLDTNTLDKRWIRPVSLTGTATPTNEFPGTDFPMIIRAAETSPSPVDVSITATFNPGSIINQNSFSLFFRERATDYMSMLDLDGTLVGDLDGEPQPDFGDAKVISQTQIDLDGIPDTTAGIEVDPGDPLGPAQLQDALNDLTQFELERKQDPLSAAYIEVRLIWSTLGVTLELRDSESATPYYSFDVPVFTANREYTLYVDLEERTMRVRIYELENNFLELLHFDTLVIDDPSIFKRRTGRLAWSANFVDGDAYLTSIRPRHLNFGEYRSHPFLSISPIDGAQLFVGATEDSNLFRWIVSGPWGGRFVAFPERGPEAFKIRNTSADPLQGIQTNSIYFDDFQETIIEFDLYVTTGLLDAGSLMLFLWDGIRPVDLGLGHLIGNTWNHIRIDLSQVIPVITGNYTVVLVQTVSSFANDWAIDKFGVKRRNVRWEGRSYVPDAWGTHEDDWIPFEDALNDINDGILFKERTNGMQIRGQALRQDAWIGEIRAIPRYAQLGRLVFDDNPLIPNESNLPVSDFDLAQDGNDITVTATSTDPDGYIVQNAWTLGDGSFDYGDVVHHTYATTGAYIVTLVTTDNNGLRSSSAQTVTVT